jgi:3-methyladenine DNA glycosylase Tag
MRTVSVGGKPLVNPWRSQAEVPSRTAESDALGRDLLRRGFKFVGSTICYAFMQAVGLVNDHTVDCFRHAQHPRKARGGEGFNPNSEMEKGSLCRRGCGHRD